MHNLVIHHSKVVCQHQLRWEIRFIEYPIVNRIDDELTVMLTNAAHLHSNSGADDFLHQPASDIREANDLPAAVIHVSVGRKGADYRLYIRGI
jgi:hypothetical protein